MKLPGVKTVLFDLDGTIIDSYPGIQKAFDNAFFRTYGVRNTTSIQSLIGPPIEKILSNCNGESNPDTIGKFVDSFKECYDTEDFKVSVPYDGIREVLKELERRQIEMFIVTNKRERPSQLIMQFLKLEGYFCDFYCSDNKGSFASKELMVQRLLQDTGVDAGDTIMVGDTMQDKNAADLNNIPFVYAGYGYGNLTNLQWQIEKPLEILHVINYIKA